MSNKPDVSIPWFPSIEDHGLVAVAEDASVEMPFDCSGKHEALQISALRNQILHLISMGDASDILFDDRPIVQHFCHVVARSANQLYASRMRGMVGPRSHEGGQE